LRQRGFSLERFVCAHAQVSSLDENKRLTDSGAFVQYDAIGIATDQFFDGATSDEAMLERLEGMITAGFGDQILLSTDAAACINPPSAQYDRNNGYAYRYFKDKVKARLGAPRTRKILRDNVVVAFRCPTKLAQREEVRRSENTAHANDAVDRRGYRRRR
jgi:hypothetical protein